MDSNEIFQRLDGVIKTGYIRNVDADAKQVRVAVDGNVTGWIDWGVWRAGLLKVWSCPDRGEKVLIAAPAGDLSMAVVLCSLYSDNGGESPSSDPEETYIKFPDGSTLVYNHGENEFNLVVTGQGMVKITCVSATVTATDSVTLDAPETLVTGNLTVKQKITGQGGMGISGGSGGAVADFGGPVRVTGGDVKVDGIGVKSHTHKEQGDGNDVGPARG